MPLKSSPGKPEPKALGGRDLVGLGLAIAVAVLVPLLAGIGIDAVAHTSPIGVLVGVLCGVAAASVAVYQRFKPYL